VGVHHPPYVEAVVGQRQGGGPAGQLPEDRRLGVEHDRGGGGPHRGDRFVKFGGGGGVHGQVDRDLKQLRLAASDPVGEIGGVVGGGIGQRVTQAPGVGVEPSAGFEP